MRYVRIFLLAGAAIWAHPANAADALKFGPAPAWVRQQPLPAAKPTEAPVSVLLSDQQTSFDRGKITTYSESAARIENAQGLAAGNVTLVWQPATDTVTVNKLQIRRGDKIIDVLASGQTFTTLRRETNLDAATLDGTLTATLQPEGLQVGDIIDLATTTERSDPVLKGHVEALFGAWDGLPILSAHAALSWPSDMHLQVRETPNLPAAQKSASNGRERLEISAQDVEPLIPPKGAPDRFKIGRLAEATDFASWSDIASLFGPLFRDASAIPASGPLHDEVEKIRSASANPKTRAEQALALVQDRVRYVALLMGQGGYVPAPAETTWSRRFGDCKAKTALLLGILHSLGIEAEPVLVQATLGDMIADRLPMVALFNHVLVRAHIGAKDYWLDGTRTGDTDLDSIQVPDFGWGLPLAGNAKLVQMVPPPLVAPSLERHIAVDASSGIWAPATVSIDELYRGDQAVGLNAAYSAVTPQQRDEAMRDEAKSFFDNMSVSSSSVQFDAAKREFRMTIKGTAKLNWKDSWLYVPTSSIAFDPNFDRPAGPLHDAPIAVNHPNFVKDEAMVRLPPDFATQQKLEPAVHETLAGVEYARAETVNSDVVTVNSSERSVAAEVPYKDAVAAVPRLRALDKEDIYLGVPGNYVPTDKDLAELQSQQPASGSEYFRRAAAYLAHNKIDEGLADLNAGLALDSNNKWALERRAWVNAQRHEYADAEKDLAALQAAEPDSLSAIGTRAYLDEQKSDYAGAVAEYSKLLERDPKNKFARTRRGLSLSSEGKNAEAIQDLSILITADPKDFGSLLNRATIEMAAGDLAAADKDVQTAVALQPNNAAVLSSAGRLAEQRGDYPLAIKYFSKQIDSQKASPYAPSLGETPLIGIGGAFAARAEAYHGLGDEKNAIADTDSAIAAGYKEPEVRLLRANIFFEQGDHERSAKEAELATAEHPKSDYAFVLAGKTYSALGMRDKAMQAFDRALSLNPKPYVYVNRAQVRAPSDTAGQLADLDAALKLQPNMPEALSVKATVLARTGKYAEAIALYDQMPASTASQVWAKSARAALLSKAGRTAEASSAFAELRARAKTAADLNSLCWDEATAGVLLDDALGECRDAVKLSNGASAYLDSLGMALLKLGKLDEALDAYSQAIAKGSGADSLMGRAFAYFKKGDRTHAEADAAAARKLSPDIDATFAEYGLKFDQASVASAAATKH